MYQKVFLGDSLLTMSGGRYLGVKYTLSVVSKVCSSRAAPTFKWITIEDKKMGIAR
jgi:hypothetical protein